MDMMEDEKEQVTIIGARGIATGTAFVQAVSYGMHYSMVGESVWCGVCGCSCRREEAHSGGNAGLPILYDGTM